MSPSFSDYVERIRQRTYSSFELMSEEEFNAGLREMERVAKSETEPQPVKARIDLLIFQRQ